MSPSFDMVSYDVFLPEVMQFVPNVPEFVAINAIRNTIIDFCTKTLYWQTNLDPITPVVGQNTYQIEVPDQTKLLAVTQAYYNEVLLIPQSPDELANIYRYTDWRTVEGHPQYVTQLMRSEVILAPIPQIVSAGDQLNLKVALAPLRDSEEVSEHIYEAFLDEISNGARAILYRTPGQPYFDRQNARECDEEYRSGISRARIEMNKGLARSSSQVEFQRII